MNRLKGLCTRLILATALTSLAGFTAACAQDSKEPTISRVAPRPANTLVMLPDGSTVHVELATTNDEREYGLMGRKSLPEGRGMLFIHDQPGRYGYWMYHCFIGLDILWMVKATTLSRCPQIPRRAKVSRRLAPPTEATRTRSMCWSCR